MVVVVLGPTGCGCGVGMVGQTSGDDGAGAGTGDGHGMPAVRVAALSVCAAMPRAPLVPAMPARSPARRRAAAGNGRSARLGVAARLRRARLMSAFTAETVESWRMAISR